jgi:hypothetical protein
VWLPDKIEKTVAKLQVREAEFGENTPLLEHTDLTVVDRNLNVTAPSFRMAVNAGYHRTALRHLVTQNIISGCTVIYNRALAELVTSEPSFMMMHDWWLGLIASAFGKIDHLDEQTILYRQHENNEIGVRDMRKFGNRFNMLLHSDKARGVLNQTYEQAKAFLELYAPLLSEEQKAFLSAYTRIPAQNKIMRCVTVSRIGAFKYGVARKIAQVLFI